MPTVQTTKFIFPEGHPRHRQTVVLGDVKFIDGVAEVPTADVEKYAAVLRWHSVAPEGSEAAKEIAAQYAPKSETQPVDPPAGDDGKGKKGKE